MQTEPRGTHSRQILNDTLACPWYANGYTNYTPNSTAIENLNKTISTEHEIWVFAGTWCGDTKNLLPKFYKVMDALHNPPAIKLIFVDREKKSGEGIEKTYAIVRIPTFIVQKNGKEIGRITESVSVSIEDDLAVIFTATP